MTFDEYWASTWKETAMPGIMDMAFREVAEKAWYAALEADRKTYEKAWNTSVESDEGDSDGLV